MNVKTTTLPLLAAALLGTGCVDMMFSGAPMNHSFGEPEVRSTIERMPKDALIGEWVSKGMADTFMAQFRVTTFATQEMLAFTADGACRYVNATLVTETYGPRQASQYVKYPVGGQLGCEYEGSWSYDGDVLKLNLSLVKKTEHLVSTSAKGAIALLFTVKWHTPSEFSLVETDDQFSQNSKSTGNAPCSYYDETRRSRFSWDARSVSPAGVETLFKKGDFSHIDETRYSYRSPFKRTTPSKFAVETTPEQSRKTAEVGNAITASPKPLYRIVGIDPKEGGRYAVRVEILDQEQTFGVLNKVKPDVQRLIREDFKSKNPGVALQYVRDYLDYRTEDDGRILVYTGWAFSVRPVEDGWQYDHESRRGWVRLRIGGGMPAEEAKRWARENIAAIVSEKNVALESGKAPPSGATFRSLGESFEGGVLTVEFEAAE